MALTLKRSRRLQWVCLDTRRGLACEGTLGIATLSLPETQMGHESKGFNSKEEEENGPLTGERSSARHHKVKERKIRLEMQSRMRGYRREQWASRKKRGWRRR